MVSVFADVRLQGHLMDIAGVQIEWLLGAVLSRIPGSHPAAVAIRGAVWTVCSLATFALTQ